MKAFGNRSFLCLCFLLIIVLYLHIISYLKVQIITNGETYSTANIAIEFALHNKIHYPLHGQDHFNPDIKVLVAHPPLFYFLSGSLLKIVGIGRWQIQLFGIITGIILILLIVFSARKFYGYPTAIAAALLCIVFEGLYYSEQLGRPDILLGLIYGFFLLVLYHTWWGKMSEKYVQLASLLLGVLAVAMMASHWNGVFGFVYFPVHLWMMACRKQNWRIHSLLFILGAIVAFIPWILGYGEEFIPVITSIFFVGVERFYVLEQQNVFNLFIPITQWSGGIVVGLGIIMGLIFLGLYFISSFFGKLASGVGWSRQKRLELFLLAGSVVYILFYLGAITNRHPQYLSNIYFPLLLFSARGYGLLWTGLKGYAANNKIYNHLILVSLLTLIGYNIFSNLDLLNPLTLEYPNKTYNIIRKTFDQFLDKQHHIFMSVSAYIYLYDYIYETNRAIEIKTVKKRVNRDYLTLQKKQDLLKSSGSIAIISKNPYMYQSRWVDEQVWSPHFKKVAAIHVKDSFTWDILYRNDIAEKTFKELGLKPDSLAIDDDIVWVTYNLSDDIPRNRKSLAEIMSPILSVPEAGLNLYIDQNYVLTNIPETILKMPSTAIKIREAKWGKDDLYLFNLSEPFSLYSLDGNVLYETFFENWRGEDYITLVHLNKVISPLKNVGYRGDFGFSRISDAVGNVIRIHSIMPGDEGQRALQVGYWLGEGHLDWDFSPGQYLAFIVTARASAKSDKFAFAFIQDETETWERKAVSINNSSWNEYIVVKKIRENSKSVICGIHIFPDNENDFIELKHVKILSLSPT